MSKKTEEETRIIECDCNEWEQFPSDMPRHKSQHFTWKENIDEGKNDGQAAYVCPSCEKDVISTSV